METRSVHDVTSCFAELIRALDHAVEAANGRGAAAFAVGDHEGAANALQKARWLTDFRGRVQQLHKDWQAHQGSQPGAVTTSVVAERPTRSVQRAQGRLRPGLRTPESAYLLPILKVLVDLGGRAHVADVLSRVGGMMEQRLTAVDRACLPSAPKCPRWWNAAQWARLEMVQDGLLRSDSPRGIWEVTEMGRRYLEQHAA